jgi:hypothetical protein
VIVSGGVDGADERGEEIGIDCAMAGSVGVMDALVVCF